MKHIKRITNIDKVTFALLLEEGKARISDLEFHVTLPKTQIRQALTQMVAQGKVAYEATSHKYRLL